MSDAKNDVKVLRKALTERGYIVERHSATAKHMRVYNPDGTPVYDADSGMPVTIANTPGDQYRWRRNIVAQLRRAGALEHNPFGGRPEPPRPEKQNGGVKLASMPPSAAELQRRELHARLIPEMEEFVRRIAGGWAQIPRIAAGAVVWMGARDLPGRPLSITEAEAQLTKLCNGNMLRFVEEQAWQALLDEVNGDSDPVLRWIEIDRQGRGI